MDDRRAKSSYRPVDWDDPGDHAQRRRFTRRQVELPARVRIEGKEISATTENVSPGGAFLRVELPPETVDLMASIQLPHGRGLFIQAKVRWRRQEPPGVGVEFATFLERPEI